ncbi:MAG: alanine--tRNA ligase, partial [Proteobacteria bacterium]|nr:alanine--tRNA ligase [Pseudomonadota bacterium]
ETGKINGSKPLPGEVAFKLYDTFGFPLDLTEDVLRGKGLKVDVAGFEAAMAKQKQQARQSWAGTGEASTSKLWFELREELGATEFLGYSTEQAEGQVLAIIRNGTRVADAKAGAEIQIIVNQTPFYAESGGQVGDTGSLTTAEGAVVRVSDTQKEANGLWVHYGVVEQGTIKTSDAVALQVDGACRALVRSNHSATHLLHEALRRALGTHVTQKGSLVAPDRLRFDISQPVPIQAAQLEGVEAEVNTRIRRNDEVTTRLMTPDAAIAEGAMALFGEKYGEEVRVVSMGGYDATAAKAYSVELCGGIHVRRTGDIGLFKIISEGAVSAGVRRIEALTGPAALAWFAEQEQRLSEVANLLKAPNAEVVSRVAQLVEDRKKLEREVADLRRQLALGGAGSTT